MSRWMMGGWMGWTERLMGGWMMDGWAEVRREEVDGKVCREQMESQMGESDG